MFVLERETLFNIRANKNIKNSPIKNHNLLVMLIEVASSREKYSAESRAIRIPSRTPRPPGANNTATPRVPANG